MQRLQQINLAKFRKEKLLIIWGCEKCKKLIPIYKSENKLIDTICLCWARDHKYCQNCEKSQPKIETDNPLLRIKHLLKIYDYEDDDYEDEEWNLNTQDP